MRRRAKTTKSHIVLIEPPLYDCRGPHLGCAILAASLQKWGQQVVLKDLNLQAILWLLQPENLEKAKVRVAKRRDVLMKRAMSSLVSGVRLSSEDCHELWRSIIAHRCGKGFEKVVSDAVDSLRNPDSFFQSSCHHAARGVIDSALDLQALACNPRLHVGLCPQQYNGPYRATSLEDLLTAADDYASNLFLPFFEQVAVPELLEYNPTLAGISISNVFQVIPGITIARLLHNAGTFVVIGGTFFSKFREQIAGRPEFFDMCDAVVIGEGEKPLLDLGAAVSDGSSLSRVPNIVFREGSRAVATHIEVTLELHDPGAADFTTLPLEQYFSPEPVLPIFAGKGCNWSQCRFCEIPQINRDFNSLRRERDPRRVAEEMRIQGLRHMARHFVFTDETLDPRLLTGIAKAIGEMGLLVNYLGYARFSEAFDDSVCERLARSGCRKLLFGLESGCQPVNNNCRKGVDLTQVPAIIEACQKAGIAVHVFTIVGLPGEGEEERNKSAEYISRLVHILDLPVSTLDVAPFYLNWNSWFRRNASLEGIRYQTAQDFPLHTDYYCLDNGMDSMTAQRAAESLQQRLRWEASWLGFDVGYRNPVWPGWEEYTLLYLSRYRGANSHTRFPWPATVQELLNKTVTVAEPLIKHQICFSLKSLFNGICDEKQSTIALSPSAKMVEVTERVLQVLARQPTYIVGNLVTELGSDSAESNDPTEALACVTMLVQAGILQW